MRNPLNLLYEAFTLQPTQNTYHLPFAPETQIQNILYDWPSHTGPFRGAIDFAIELGTPILAPLDGEVIEIVSHHTKYGPGREFAPYLNYLTIAHTHGEYSQYGHIAAGSVQVQIGDQVQLGQPIAQTGLNGWMEPPFLEHLHFFVFTIPPSLPFKGLKIRFQQQPKVSKRV